MLLETLNAVHAGHEAALYHAPCTCTYDQLLWGVQFNYFLLVFPCKSLQTSENATPFPNPPNRLPVTAMALT